MVNLNYLNNKQAQLVSDTDTLAQIREHFSVSNPAYRRASRFAQARLYAITPSGKFEIGLTDNLIAYLEANQILHTVDARILSKTNFEFNVLQIKTYEKFKYRDHQEKSIKAAIKKGRGLIVIPTAGGKTLIMSGIIESMRKSLNKPNAKALVIVPSIQLVTQTSKDFLDYGMERVTRWSGDNQPDPNATTIIAGTQILMSDKSDLTSLADVEILLIDEAHGIRKGNEINKIFNFINTDHKFGFTGTLPPSMIDVWNMIGKIGPILYEEKTLDLKNKNYVSDFQVVILNIKHSNLPNFSSSASLPAAQYNAELDYLLNNERRNEIIGKIALRVKNNTIIMVDRIDHGIAIEKKLRSLQIKEDPSLSKSSHNPPRPVFFIRGSTEMDERERIRSLMEERNDIIVVAVSKIFSTGINIPNLHNIIFASAGKAKIKIMQSIGRALRLHPTKTMATIFDIADNTKYGKIHASERIKLYEKEKYKYQSNNI
jgi:superfamily II DNA or RNA helicase